MATKKTATGHKLTDKQAAFIDEYLVDLNATQAAIRSGYSKHTARQTGADNLAKPYIREEIDARLEARSKRVEITQDNVLRRLSAIAFSKMSDVGVIRDGKFHVFDMEDMPEVAIEAIEAIETLPGGRIKVKMRKAERALDMAGRHLGMWKGDVGGQNATEAARDVADATRAMFSTIPAAPPNGEDVDEIAGHVEGMTDEEVEKALAELGA